MIRPSPDSQVYLYRPPIDMRKSINGLVAIVEGEMALDPFNSALFVFCNTSRSLVKMVGWEGNGFVLWMKRICVSSIPIVRPVPIAKCPPKSSIVSIALQRNLKTTTLTPRMTQPMGA